MESQQGNIIYQMLLLVVFAIPIVIVAYKLAQEKGRNATNWIILGAIPIINFFSLWYFIGASNLRLEKKIDKLLKVKLSE